MSKGIGCLLPERELSFRCRAAIPADAAVTGGFFDEDAPCRSGGSPEAAAPLVCGERCGESMTANRGLSVSERSEALLAATSGGEGALPAVPVVAAVVLLDDEPLCSLSCQNAKADALDLAVILCQVCLEVGWLDIRALPYTYPRSYEKNSIWRWFAKSSKEG